MVVPSPVGDVKMVSLVGTFVLNTVTLKKSVLFLSCYFRLYIVYRLPYAIQQ